MNDTYAAFTATKREHALIKKIVTRAQHLAVDAGFHYTTTDAMMDVEACHCNGNPLDLKKLLGFDDFNFAHDVFGIRRHIDRTEGKLLDCFLPRSTNTKKMRRERAKAIAKAGV